MLETLEELERRALLSPPPEVSDDEAQAVSPLYADQELLEAEPFIRPDEVLIDEGSSQEEVEEFVDIEGPNGSEEPMNSPSDSGVSDSGSSDSGSSDSGSSDSDTTDSDNNNNDHTEPEESEYQEELVEEAEAEIEQDPTETVISQEPEDDPYLDLYSFTLDATPEDLEKRNESLAETNTFFTRGAFNAYTMSRIEYMDPEVFESIQDVRERLRKRLLELDQSSPNDIQEKDKIQLDTIEEDVKADHMETDQKPDDITDSKKHVALKLTEPFQPATDIPLPITSDLTPQTVETPARKKPKVSAPTILDDVLTDMLRFNRSQATTQEPSDLEIAAMAAGSDVPSQSSVRSKFTEEQHIKFLRISESLRSGSSSIPESDMEMYKRMCIDIKQEQDNYVNEQKRKVLESGVLHILDEKVEKMVREYCKIEQDRLSQYPQFYKYFNLLHMPVPDSSSEPSVLSFKCSLLQTGKIASCKPSAMETPRRLDLFKKYIVTPSSETIKEEDEEIGNYYRKKLPPTVSVDENITQLIQTHEADIVISSECLVSLVELVNDVSLDLFIPIRVIEKDGKNILMFDRPLPKEGMTGRERNKLIYDIAFKSLCLDWPNRHDISSLTKETGKAEGDQEENLQYNMWKFGEMNILIRHQIDGELIETGTKKSGSKDKRVYLTSKLDYQINEGREEITPANERAVNWIRSYIAGHATVLEGRIDVVNNRLIRIDRKEMVDIMGGQWRPMLESELLRFTFSKLHKTLLEPGHYLLQHKKDDRNFLIFQGTDTPSDLDLLSKKKLPILSKPDKSFIPAWSAIENQIPWTFQPNK